MTVSSFTLAVVHITIVVLLSAPCEVKCVGPYHADSTDVLEKDSVTADSLFLNLRSVEVTAGLVPERLTKAPFSVEVVDSVSLSSQPVRSLTDALAYVPGVDIRRRGALGIQTDVAIRGGTFEQTAIMLNGIRLNDVQTGHNTLSIPFLPSDIERIEVVKGGAARFFGAGALDGAVNIITKQTANNALTASLVGGDVGYVEGRLSGSMITGPVAHRISVQGLKHNGWIPNTDAEVYSAMYQTSLHKDTWNASVLLGVNSKAFGANGFYTPKFPDQFEKVLTYLLGATASTVLDSLSDLTFRLASRVNHDDFVLRRYDPDFYHNIHRTDAHLMQVGYKRGTETESVATLIEFGSDAISSTNLGNHQRFRGSIMAQYAVELGLLNLSGGIGVMLFSDRASLPTGGVEATFDVSSTANANNVFFGNVQRSGRIPTYTELYYTDPQTTGNANLVPEHAITAELGYRSSAASHHVQASAFVRMGQNIIDYAIDSMGLATAANITTVNVGGIDVSSTFAFNSSFIRSIKAGLTLQQVNASSPQPTRYVADNLAILGILETRFFLPLGIQANYLLRVVERVTNSTVYGSHDLKINRTIGMLTAFAEVTNISNVSYVETGYIPIPPRWFRAGMSVTY